MSEDLIPPKTPPVRIIKEGDTSAKPPEPPKLPPNRVRSDGGLTEAKARLLKTIAKVLAIAATGLLPAGVGWLDSKTEAQTALTAAATEKATNDVAYVELVDRIAGLEILLTELGDVTEDYGEGLDDCGDQLIRHEERIASLQRRHGIRHRPGHDAVDIAAVVGPPKPPGKLAELLKAAKMKKPLPKKRPKADREMVQQVQQAYEDGEF